MKIVVQISVDPILKEFIQAWYGSDLIKSSKNCTLSRKIKYHLSRPPEDFTNKTSECFINVELVDSFFIKTNNKTNRIRTIYRNYLSEDAQSAICCDLTDWFKNIFRNFVAGFVMANNLKIGSQKKAILMFCDIYNLTLDNINYEMLKKDWDRSSQKCTIWNNYKLVKKVS
jgi:hypothetical protein